MSLKFTPSSTSSCANSNFTASIVRDPPSIWLSLDHRTAIAAFSPLNYAPSAPLAVQRDEKRATSIGVTRRALSLGALCSPALAFSGCAGTEISGIVKPPAKYSDKPEMMAIGDSLYQGVRSLTFTKGMGALSPPALVAARSNYGFHRARATASHFVRFGRYLSASIAASHSFC
jgi:hypothetical protein